MSIPPHIWQDIRFDCRPTFLAPRKSEYIIDSINSVEDTKGNNGERGSLIVTNLRIIWVSHKKAKTNLSIGFQCVIGVSIKKAKSRMRGQTSALFLMTKFTNSRFEFIFTSLVTNSPRLFTTVQSVLRAYESTKLYRDLKLRGSIMKNQKVRCVAISLKGAPYLSSDFFVRRGSSNTTPQTHKPNLHHTTPPYQP